MSTGHSQLVSPPRRRFARVAASVVLSTVGACASGSAGKVDRAPQSTPPVAAERTVMGSATVWVAHGESFDVIAPESHDVSVVMPQVARAHAAYVQAFGAAPRRLQVVVEHPPAPGEAARHLDIPATDGVERVTLWLGEPNAARGQDEGARRGGERARGGARGGAPPRGEPRAQFASVAARPVMRAWLSARAATLTGRPSTPAQSAGEMDDPRVPAWGIDALLGLGIDSARVRAISASIADNDSLYPLTRFLTMLHPSTSFPQVAAGGGGDGEGRPAMGGRGEGRGGGGGEGGGGGRGIRRRRLRRSRRLWRWGNGGAGDGRGRGTRPARG